MDGGAGVPPRLHKLTHKIYETQRAGRARMAILEFLNNGYPFFKVRWRTVKQKGDPFFLWNGWNEAHRLSPIFGTIYYFGMDEWLTMTINLVCITCTF